jgi:hypothetical protein
MARAAAKYVFAALLALLSTQAAVPSVRVVTAIEIVCRTEAEQQAPREARRIRADIQASGHPRLRMCRGPGPNRTPPFCSSGHLPQPLSSRNYNLQA